MLLFRMESDNSMEPNDVQQAVASKLLFETNMKDVEERAKRILSYISLLGFGGFMMVAIERKCMIAFFIFAIVATFIIMVLCYADDNADHTR